MSLFGDPDDAPANKKSAPAPLADRMRPRTLGEFLGQDEALGGGRALRRAIEAGAAGSLILWGPPGTGKTTLAQLIAKHAGLVFVPFSAVLSGVAQVREAVAAAGQRRDRTRQAQLPVVRGVHP